MRRLLLALFAVLGFALSASASPLCVEVSIAGRPLPNGLVTLVPDTLRAWAGADAFGGARPRPGTSERVSARLRDGRRCLDAVAPGNYILRVAPGSAWWPLDLVHRGLTGNATGYRLSVSEDGTLGIFDQDGRRREEASTSPLRLDYEAPAEHPAVLAVRLKFPDGVRPDFDKEPALFVLSYARAGKRGRPRYVCRWLSGGADGGTLAFRTEVPEAGLLEAGFVSGPWAVAGTEPALFWPDGPGPGAPGPKTLELRVARGKRLSGTIRRPDGRPFRSRITDDERTVSTVSVLLPPSGEGSGLQAYADEDGVYEFTAVAPGWAHVRPLCRAWGQNGRALFDWSVPGGAWVSMDEDRSVDFRLRPWATLVLGAGAVALPPSPGLRVVGVPAGTRPPGLAAALYYVDDTPISLTPGPDGVWEASRAEALSEPGAVRVPAGRYDFYLLERTEDPAPSLRPLRAPETRDLPERGAVGLRLPGPYEKAGTCSLQARLRVAGAPRAGDLRLAPPELHARLVPRITLYKEGVWEGTAFGEVDRELGDAVMRGDAGGIRRLLTDRVWSLGLSGLGPGRYRAVASLPGRPDRAQELVLTPGAPARLEWVIDAVLP